jgi:hypothetical protein
VRFFTPAGGGLVNGEAPGDLAVRLLAEIRAEAPIVSAKRERRAKQDRRANQPA